MKKLIALAVLVLGCWVPGVFATQMQVYGVWHCSDDFCIWGSVRDMTDFDVKNHWLIDRGNGQPSVNVVVLSFVQPVKLMDKTTDSQTLSGVPVGMNQAVVSYFTSHNVRVMLSIGGQTYTKDWDTALAANPTQLGLNAAAVAKSLGVGFEIDYENNTSPNITGLQAFVSAYRSQVPYDATGSNPAARLTIDLGNSDTYLEQIAQYAGQNWLGTANPVLDYANVMVPSKQSSASKYESYWQQHITGTSSVPPLAPAKFIGSLFLVTGKTPAPECTTFSTSLQNSTGNFVENVAPAGAGRSSGMLGYMFWAAECQGKTTVCTTPPNTCEGGVGVGATTYSIPIPMPALRQQ